MRFFGIILTKKLLDNLAKLWIFYLIIIAIVRILNDLDRDITGRNVLIVEDIVDSGLTLSWLKANLESRGVGSVEILSILRKPEAAKVEVDVKYVGFDIPKDFVIGYGLDFDEKYRNLPFIGVLAKHMYE